VALSFALKDIQSIQDALRNTALTHNQRPGVPGHCRKVIDIADRFADRLKQNSDLLKQKAERQLQIAALLSRDLRARLQSCRTAFETVKINNRKLRITPTIEQFTITIDSVNIYLKHAYNTTNIIYRIDHAWFVSARNSIFPENVHEFYRVYTMEIENITKQFIHFRTDNSPSTHMTTNNIKNSRWTKSQGLYIDFWKILSRREFLMSQLCINFTELLDSLNRLIPFQN